MARGGGGVAECDGEILVALYVQHMLVRCFCSLKIGGSRRLGTLIFSWFQTSNRFSSSTTYNSILPEGYRRHDKRQTNSGSLTNILLRNKIIYADADGTAPSEVSC